MKNWDVLKEGRGFNLDDSENEDLGNSLNEVLPFLLGDGNISGIRDLDISHFGNDGVNWKIETLKFETLGGIGDSEKLGKGKFGGRSKMGWARTGVFILL